MPSPRRPRRRNKYVGRRAKQPATSMMRYYTPMSARDTYVFMAGFVLAVALAIWGSTAWYHSWWSTQPVDLSCEESQGNYDMLELSDYHLNDDGKGGHRPRPVCLDNDGRTRHGEVQDYFHVRG